MPVVDTDRAWEQVAQTDPYWGVLTSDEFLGDGLDATTERAFFASGETHIAHVLEVIRARLQADFAPASALDYGCGVGRLLLPLSALAPRVVGVDVSDSMMARAATHLAAAGYPSVSLIKPEQLPTVEPVDLIHSTIVLQHIHPKRGMAIVDQLLGVLAPGGCGSLQFHVRGDGGQAMRLSRRVLEESQVINVLAVKVLRRPAREALVLMHPYDLTAVLRLLALHGIADSFIETVATPTGYTDATVYFRKPEQ